MRKIGIIAVLSLLVTGFAAVPALAVTNFDNAPSGAHYRQGFAEPVCTTSTVPTTGAISVSCTGTQIAGVGHGQLRLSQSWQRKHCRAAQRHRYRHNYRTSCPIEERHADRSRSFG